MVLAAHVIGYKVDNHFQSCLVRSLYKAVEFQHALRDIDSQIGVDVIVILYGIWAPGTAFYDCRMIACDAVWRLVRLGGVLYQSCKPYMRVAVGLDATQHGLRKAIEFCTTVLFDASLLNIVGARVSVQTCKYLIYRHL